MKSIRIAGVPEHFNLPWHLAIEAFNEQQKAVHLQWTDYPGGTGDMCTALRENTADAAILLTEGILKDVAAGNPAKILMVYISSPLIWGVHVSGKSPLTDVTELNGKTAAISRFGSGSHLMANVLANSVTIPTDSLQFEVVGNLEGARASLASNPIHYFMWEKYTTKPLVDSGEFKRIGECPTPWPCFVLAANPEFENWDQLPEFLELLREKARWIKESPRAIELIAERYQLKAGDVTEWRNQTQWMQLEWTDSLKNKILEKMRQYKLIDSQT